MAEETDTIIAFCEQNPVLMRFCNSEWLRLRRSSIVAVKGNGTATLYRSISHHWLRPCVLFPCAFQMAMQFFSEVNPICIIWATITMGLVSHFYWQFYGRHFRVQSNFGLSCGTPSPQLLLMWCGGSFISIFFWPFWFVSPISSIWAVQGASVNDNHNSNRNDTFVRVGSTTSTSLIVLLYVNFWGCPESKKKQLVL